MDGNYSCPAHEEADTKIAYHVFNTQRDAIYYIKCTDIDILFILLSNMSEIKNGKSKVWIYGGKHKNPKTINITALHKQLGPELCSSLAAFHAFTGCDCDPSFYRKEKLRPLNILQPSKQFELIIPNSF